MLLEQKKNQRIFAVFFECKVKIAAWLPLTGVSLEKAGVSIKEATFKFSRFLNSDMCRVVANAKKKSADSQEPQKLSTKLLYKREPIQSIPDTLWQIWRKFGNEEGKKKQSTSKRSNSNDQYLPWLAAIACKYGISGERKSPRSVVSIVKYCIMQTST